MSIGVVAEARQLLAAQIGYLDEAGSEAVEERPEVYDAAGEDAEALDDLGADGYGPGGVNGVGCLRGAIDVYHLDNDCCDDTGA